MPEIPTSQPGVFATTCCNKRGSLHPEGNVAGTVGCVYRMNDGTKYSFFYKETDDGTSTGGNTGWVETDVLNP